MQWEKRLRIDPVTGNVDNDTSPMGLLERFKRQLGNFGPVNTGNPLPQLITIDEDLTLEEKEAFERSRRRIHEMAAGPLDGGIRTPGLQPRKSFVKRQRPWMDIIRRPRTELPKVFKPTFTLKRA